MTAEPVADVPMWPEHAGPWNEEDFLALCPTTWPRVELIDGSLLVTPGPGSRHQQWAARLRNLLEAAAPDDVEVYEGVNVRMRSGMIRIPDVVVTRELGAVTVFQPGLVVLVAEVVSPGGAAADKGVKAGHYAEAGIRWYLLVEPVADGTPRLLLWQLTGSGYAEYATARSGQQLALPAPLAGGIDPAELLHRRRA